MKNFPHQINDLEKLTAALLVIEQLIKSGKDVLDDAVFGEALARKGVYTFRDKARSLKDSLAEEKKKPRASRGTEAAARDLRRFFCLLDYIALSEAPEKVSLTKYGKRVLRAATVAASMPQWRNSMRSIALEDNDGNVSHPYDILVRLVADAPGLDRKKLMLALEAKNDSNAEYERVLKLSGKDYGKIVEATNVSDATARNAVKILPRIAFQLGDIILDGTKVYPAAVVTVTEEGAFTSPNKLPPKSSK